MDNISSKTLALRCLEMAVDVETRGHDFDAVIQTAERFQDFVRSGGSGANVRSGPASPICDNININPEATRPCGDHIEAHRSGKNGAASGVDE